MLISFLLLPWVVEAGLQQDQQKRNDKCDFSGYRYLGKSDYKIPVKKRVEAEYPPMAKEAKVAGVVQVRVLVNQEGNVIRTCAVDGHPTLRGTAIAAAREWKFVRYFGLMSGQKIKYMQEWIIFNFTLNSAK